jgi:predicted dehydrogenase
MIKVGIIGAGLIGKKRAESISSGNQEGKIIAICDVDIEKAEALASKFGADAYEDWKDIIKNKEINTVVVSTPNKYLKEISLTALENNKNVLCEKPLGISTREAEEIYLKAKEKRRILKTGFNHRHHPAIHKAKELMDNMTIGNIYYIRCIYGHGGRPGYEKEWRASKDLCGGGELLDQGVHIVDLFRWFLGEFIEVFGKINTFYWKIEVEDNAFAIFRTKKGQVAVMHTSWTQWKNRFLFEIFGRKGYLIVDGLGRSYGTEKLIIGKRKTKGRKTEKNIGGPPQEKVIEFPGPDISWIEEWQEFTSAIKENREPLGSGYDGLMANKLIESVYLSARLNKPINIDICNKIL